MSLGDGVKIVGPERVVEQMKNEDIRLKMPIWMIRYLILAESYWVCGNLMRFLFMGVECRLLDNPLCYTLFIKGIYPKIFVVYRRWQKCLRDLYSG